ncbi:MAG TPA: HD domain-containing phosphohydrolase [Gaiellaceae bacterium]|nr:HD domain-containing phosphohydrolase [Gaiellaceae bacterium]
MPGSLTWLLVAVGVWVLVSVPLTLFLGRALHVAGWPDRVAHGPAQVQKSVAVLAEPPVAERRPDSVAPRRVLIVDDDAGLRMLLRATLTADELEVAEAEDAQRASDLVRFWRPAIVLLDVAMPGIDGLSFCAELKGRPAFGSPAVVLLTGTELADEEAARAGADALLRKPFSPLELVGVLDRLTGADGADVRTDPYEAPGEQLLLYARDLGRLLEIERMQRRVVQDAYRETVTALANALEAKDTGTRLHSLRVRDYAVQLTGAVEPGLLGDPSLEYGFLLHDVGKIGVPNEVLEKPGALTPDEFELIRQHPVIGAEILSDVTFLNGEGLKVIRSHHERWDGTGYPDRLRGPAIPLGARIFAVADALDAMTGDRPYREPATWEAARSEIASQSGRQFDPGVVDAFMRKSRDLRRLHHITGKAA